MEHGMESTQIEILVFELLCLVHSCKADNIMAARDPEIYKVTLKSWLYERINENKNRQQYRGLEWMDEGQRIFQLPWVTENDPNWREYYQLFYDWASRSGNASSTSQKVKRNFRSALNHSKHFALMKDMGEELQTGSYKVYKFLTEEEIKSQRHTKQRNFSEESCSSSQGAFTPESQSYNHNPGYVERSRAFCGMPAVVMQNGQMMNDMNFEQRRFHPHPSQTALMGSVNIQERQEYPTSSVATADVEMASIPSIENDNVALAWGRLQEMGVTEHDVTNCTLTVEYNGKKTRLYEVSLLPGCVIKFAAGQTPEDARPDVVFLDGVDQQRSPGLHKILDNMKRGIFLFYDPTTLSICVSRECLAHVYCFGTHDEEELLCATNSPGCPLRIVKKRRYIAFSYVQFLNEIGNRSFDLDAHHSIPSHTVEIVVGVQPDPGRRGRATKGVKISLQPYGANKISNCEDPTGPQDVEVSCESQPDSRGLMPNPHPHHLLHCA